MARWRMAPTIRRPKQMTASSDVALEPKVLETKILEPKAPAKAAAPATKVTRPVMMRQYDLVEQVRAYNPDTDEALLNRAYVYAMKAHGEQRRASGDPYFSHPLEVAAI